MFLYCEALSEYTDCATDSSIKDALIRFKFFPSVSELGEFFKEHRQNDPGWTPPASEFEPPYELASVFEAWRKAIGAAAYRAWLIGAQVWTKPGGGIAINAASAFKANWIRTHYVATLEALAQQPVAITHAGDAKAVRHWPHNGPPAGTAAGWWQTHDPKTGAEVDPTEPLAALDAWRSIV